MANPAIPIDNPLGPRHQGDQPLIPGVDDITSGIGGVLEEVTQSLQVPDRPITTQLEKLESATTPAEAYDAMSGGVQAVVRVELDGIVTAVKKAAQKQGADANAFLASDDYKDLVSSIVEKKLGLKDAELTVAISEKLSEMKFDDIVEFSTKMGATLNLQQFVTEEEMSGMERRFTNFGRALENRFKTLSGGVRQTAMLVANVTANSEITGRKKAELLGRSVIRGAHTAAQAFSQLGLAIPEVAAYSANELIFNAGVRQVDKVLESRYGINFSSLLRRGKLNRFIVSTSETLAGSHRGMNYFKAFDDLSAIVAADGMTMEDLDFNTFSELVGESSDLAAIKNSVESIASNPIAFAEILKQTTPDRNLHVLANEILQDVREGKKIDPNSVFSLMTYAHSLSRNNLDLQHALAIGVGGMTAREFRQLTGRFCQLAGIMVGPQLIFGAGTALAARAGTLAGIANVQQLQQLYGFTRSVSMATNTNVWSTIVDKFETMKETARIFDEQGRFNPNVDAEALQLLGITSAYGFLQSKLVEVTGNPNVTLMVDEFGTTVSGWLRSSNADNRFSKFMNTFAEAITLNRVVSSVNGLPPALDAMSGPAVATFQGAEDAMNHNLFGIIQNGEQARVIEDGVVWTAENIDGEVVVSSANINEGGVPQVKQFIVNPEELPADINSMSDIVDGAQLVAAITDEQTVIPIQNKDGTVSSFRIQPSVSTPENLPASVATPDEALQVAKTYGLQIGAGDEAQFVQAVNDWLANQRTEVDTGSNTVPKTDETAEAINPALGVAGAINGLNPDTTQDSQPAQVESGRGQMGYIALDAAQQARGTGDQFGVGQGSGSTGGVAGVEGNQGDGTAINLSNWKQPSDVVDGELLAERIKGVTQIIGDMELADGDEIAGITMGTLRDDTFREALNSLTIETEEGEDLDGAIIRHFSQNPDHPEYAEFAGYADAVLKYPATIELLAAGAGIDTETGVMTLADVPADAPEFFASTVSATGNLGQDSPGVVKQLVDLTAEMAVLRTNGQYNAGINENIINARVLTQISEAEVNALDSLTQEDIEGGIEAIKAKMNSVGGDEINRDFVNQAAAFLAYEPTRNEVIEGMFDATIAIDGKEYPTVFNREAKLARIEILTEERNLTVQELEDDQSEVSVVEEEQPIDDPNTFINEEKWQVDKDYNQVSRENIDGRNRIIMKINSDDESIFIDNNSIAGNERAGIFPDESGADWHIAYQEIGGRMEVAGIFDGDSFITISLTDSENGIKTYSTEDEQFELTFRNGTLDIVKENGEEVWDNLGISDEQVQQPEVAAAVPEPVDDPSTFTINNEEWEEDTSFNTGGNAFVKVEGTDQNRVLRKLTSEDGSIGYIDNNSYTNNEAAGAFTVSGNNSVDKDPAEDWLVELRLSYSQPADGEEGSPRTTDIIGVFDGEEFIEFYSHSLNNGSGEARVVVKENSFDLVFEDGRLVYVKQVVTGEPIWGTDPEASDTAADPSTKTTTDDGKEWRVLVDGRERNIVKLSGGIAGLPGSEKLYVDNNQNLEGSSLPGEMKISENQTLKLVYKQETQADGTVTYVTEGVILESILDNGSTFKEYKELQDGDINQNATLDDVASQDSDTKQQSASFFYGTTYTFEFENGSVTNVMDNSGAVWENAQIRDDQVVQPPPTSNNDELVDDPNTFINEEKWQVDKDYNQVSRENIDGRNRIIMKINSDDESIFIDNNSIAGNERAGIFTDENNQEWHLAYKEEGGEMSVAGIFDGQDLTPLNLLTEEDGRQVYNSADNSLRLTFENGTLLTVKDFNGEVVWGTGSEASDTAADPSTQRTTDYGTEWGVDVAGQQRNLTQLPSVVAREEIFYVDNDLNPDDGIVPGEMELAGGEKWNLVYRFDSDSNTGALHGVLVQDGDRRSIVPFTQVTEGEKPGILNATLDTGSDEQADHKIEFVNGRANTVTDTRTGEMIWDNLQISRDQAVSQGEESADSQTDNQSAAEAPSQQQPATDSSQSDQTTPEEDEVILPDTPADDVPQNFETFKGGSLTFRWQEDGLITDAGDSTDNIQYQQTFGEDDLEGVKDQLPEQIQDARRLAVVTYNSTPSLLVDSTDGDEDNQLLPLGLSQTDEFNNAIREAFNLDESFQNIEGEGGGIGDVSSPTGDDDTDDGDGDDEAGPGAVPGVIQDIVEELTDINSDNDRAAILDGKNILLNSDISVEERLEATSWLFDRLKDSGQDNNLKASYASIIIEVNAERVTFEANAGRTIGALTTDILLGNTEGELDGIENEIKDFITGYRPDDGVGDNEQPADSELVNNTISALDSDPLEDNQEAITNSIDGLSDTTPAEELNTINTELDNALASGDENRVKNAEAYILALLEKGVTSVGGISVIDADTVEALRGISPVLGNENATLTSNLALAKIAADDATSGLISAELFEQIRSDAGKIDETPDADGTPAWEKNIQIIMALGYLNPGSVNPAVQRYLDSNEINGVIEIQSRDPENLTRYYIHDPVRGEELGHSDVIELSTGNQGYFVKNDGTIYFENGQEFASQRVGDPVNSTEELVDAIADITLVEETLESEGNRRQGRAYTRALANQLNLLEDKSITVNGVEYTFKDGVSRQDLIEFNRSLNNGSTFEEAFQSLTDAGIVADPNEQATSVSETVEIPTDIQQAINTTTDGKYIKEEDEPALERIREYLGDSDRSDEEKRDVVYTVFELIGGDDLLAKRDALWLAGHIFQVEGVVAQLDGADVEALGEAVRSADTTVASRAIWAIEVIAGNGGVELGLIGKEGVEALGEAVRSADAEVASGAIWAIEVIAANGGVELGLIGKEGVEALGEVVRSADATVASGAIWAIEVIAANGGVELGLIGKGEVEALGEGVRSADAGVASRAAWAIGSIADNGGVELGLIGKEGVEALGEAVRSADAGVASSAALAIGSIADNGGVELGLIGKEEVEALGEGVRSADARVASRAAWASWQIISNGGNGLFDSADIDALGGAAGDTDPYVSGHSISALNAMAEAVGLVDRIDKENASEEQINTVVSDIKAQLEAGTEDVEEARATEDGAAVQPVAEATVTAEVASTATDVPATEPTIEPQDTNPFDVFTGNPDVGADIEIGEGQSVSLDPTATEDNTEATATATPQQATPTPEVESDIDDSQQPVTAPLDELPQDEYYVLNGQATLDNIREYSGSDSRVEVIEDGDSGEIVLNNTTTIPFSIDRTVNILTVTINTQDEDTGRVLAEFQELVGFLGLNMPIVGGGGDEVIDLVAEQLMGQITDPQDLQRYLGVVVNRDNILLEDYPFSDGDQVEQMDLRPTNLIIGGKLYAETVVEPESADMSGELYESIEQKYLVELEIRQNDSGGEELSTVGSPAGSQYIVTGDTSELREELDKYYQGIGNYPNIFKTIFYSDDPASEDDGIIILDLDNEDNDRAIVSKTGEFVGVVQSINFSEGGPSGAFSVMHTPENHPGVSSENSITVMLPDTTDFGDLRSELGNEFHFSYDPNSLATGEITQVSTISDTDVKVGIYYDPNAAEGYQQIPVLYRETELVDGALPATVTAAADITATATSGATEAATQRIDPTANDTQASATGTPTDVPTDNPTVLPTSTPEPIATEAITEQATGEVAEATANAEDPRGIPAPTETASNTPVGTLGEDGTDPENLEQTRVPEDDSEMNRLTDVEAIPDGALFYGAGLTFQIISDEVRDDLGNSTDIWEKERIYSDQFESLEHLPQDLGDRDQLIFAKYKDRNVLLVYREEGERSNDVIDLSAPENQALAQEIQEYYGLDSNFNVPFDKIASQFLQDHAPEIAIIASALIALSLNSAEVKFRREGSLTFRRRSLDLYNTFQKLIAQKTGYYGYLSDFSTFRNEYMYDGNSYDAKIDLSSLDVSNSTESIMQQITQAVQQLSKRIFPYLGRAGSPDEAQRAINRFIQGGEGLDGAPAATDGTKYFMLSEDNGVDRQNTTITKYDGDKTIYLKDEDGALTQVSGIVSRLGNSPEDLGELQTSGGQLAKGQKITRFLAPSFVDNLGGAKSEEDATKRKAELAQRINRYMQKSIGAQIVDRVRRQPSLKLTGENIIVRDGEVYIVTSGAVQPEEQVYADSIGDEPIDKPVNVPTNTSDTKREGEETSDLLSDTLADFSQELGIVAGDAIITWFKDLDNIENKQAKGQKIEELNSSIRNALSNGTELDKQKAVKAVGRIAEQAKSDRLREVLNIDLMQQVNGFITPDQSDPVLLGNAIQAVRRVARSGGVGDGYVNSETMSAIHAMFNVELADGERQKSLIEEDSKLRRNFFNTIGYIANNRGVYQGLITGETMNILKRELQSATATPENIEEVLDIIREVSDREFAIGSSAGTLPKDSLIDGKLVQAISARIPNNEDPTQVKALVETISELIYEKGIEASGITVDIVNDVMQGTLTTERISFVDRLVNSGGVQADLVGEEIKDKLRAAEKDGSLTPTQKGWVKEILEEIRGGVEELPTEIHGTIDLLNNDLASVDKIRELNDYIGNFYTPNNEKEMVVNQLTPEGIWSIAEQLESVGYQAAELIDKIAMRGGTSKIEPRVVSKLAECLLSDQVFLPGKSHDALGSIVRTSGDNSEIEDIILTSFTNAVKDGNKDIAHRSAHSIGWMIGERNKGTISKDTVEALRKRRSEIEGNKKGTFDEALNKIAKALGVDEENLLKDIGKDNIDQQINNLVGLMNSKIDERGEGSSLAEEGSDGESGSQSEVEEGQENTSDGSGQFRFSRDLRYRYM